MAKKRLVKKKVDISKKNFEIFAQGVERLKDLEKELNSLNTKGHYREDLYIRSRLKSVSEIPNIERAIKRLKLKIRNKYKTPTKKKSKVNRDLRAIREEIPKLKLKLGGLVGLRNELPLIEQELLELSSKFDSIRDRSKIKIDSGVGIVVNHDFNDFLKNIKVDLSTRVKEKEEELHEAVMIELARKEKIYGQKHKKLITDFQNKEKEIITRLRNKERSLKLSSDKRYNSKVKSILNKEVAAKLEERVKQKFEEKKNYLTKQYKDYLRNHSAKLIEDHKNRITSALKRELASKIRKYHREEEAEKSKYQDKQQELSKKGKKLIEDKKNIKYTYEKRLDKEISELVKEEKKYKKGVKAKSKLQLKKDRQRVVDTIERKLNLDYANLSKKETLLKKEEKELKEKKERYELRKKNELRKAKSKLAKAFNFKLQYELTKKDQDVHDLKDKVVQEYHKKLNAGLKKRELEIRSDLKKKYDLELKANIREQENLLKKKKIALEAQIQKKLKGILN